MACGALQNGSTKPLSLAPPGWSSHSSWSSRPPNSGPLWLRSQSNFGPISGAARLTRELYTMAGEACASCCCLRRTGCFWRLGCRYSFWELPSFFWLTPGPRPVGGVVFDTHTMFFGMIFALTGAQILAIGAFAKVYSYSERFLSNQRSLARWLRRIKLEDGLMLGLALISDRRRRVVLALLGVGGQRFRPFRSNASAYFLRDRGFSLACKPYFLHSLLAC